MSTEGTWIAIGSGLGAALCFGTGDFLAQRLAHRHGAMSAMFAVQLVGVVVLAAVASAWHGAPVASSEVILSVLGIGLVNTVAIVGLYRAFETGKLSLVSPIAGSMGAFTVGFAWLAGQTPPASVILGLLAAVFGIVVASVVDEPNGASKKLEPALGVGWALVSAVGFGWVLFVLGPHSATLGPAWTIAMLRMVALVLVLALARPLGWRLMGALRSEPDKPASRGRTFVVACLDSSGMVFVAWGSSRGLVAGETAIVAVLASCFPLVTIALARVYLREGLRWWQWIGVAIVIAAVAWVSSLL